MDLITNSQRSYAEVSQLTPAQRGPMAVQASRDQTPHFQQGRGYTSISSRQVNASNTCKMKEKLNCY